MVCKSVPNGGRPGFQGTAIAEDAEDKTHIARPAVGGTRRRRVRIALNIEAQRVGVAIVGKNSFQWRERLRVEFRSEPRMPAQVEMIGIIETPDFDAALSIGLKNHRRTAAPAR